MSTALPVISVPSTLADRIKKYNSLDQESSEIKEILDAAFNYILAEAADGRAVTIPKAFKVSRKLLDQRTFRNPNDQTGKTTTTKPARYSLNLSVMTAAKIAFESIPVNADAAADADGAVVANGSDDGSDATVTVVAKKKKAAPKKAAAAKPEIVASDSEAEEIKPAAAAATAVKKEPKAKKAAKEPKAKKEKKGGKVVEMQNEAYDDIDGMSDEL